MKIWGLKRKEQKHSTTAHSTQRNVPNAILENKAPFGSISNMTNPVGICSYCRIDPQTPSAIVVVQSVKPNGETDCLLFISASHKEKEFLKMKNSFGYPQNNFVSIVSKSEWARTQELADKNLGKLAKSGLLDYDEFDFDYDEQYEAEQEMKKFVSSRLPYVD